MTSSSNVASSDTFEACEDLAANVDEAGVVALSTRIAEAAAAGERGNLLELRESTKSTDPYKNLMSMSRRNIFGDSHSTCIATLPIILDLE